MNMDLSASTVLPRNRVTIRQNFVNQPFCGTCTTKDPLIEVAEKISALVLTVFAAVTQISLFVPFFLTGCAYGAYTESTDPSNNSSFSSGGGCSQGFLEDITGVKLPKPVSLIANTAVTYCHIEHHSDVFVPLVGITSGIWVGKECHKGFVSLQNTIHLMINNSFLDQIF